MTLATVTDILTSIAAVTVSVAAVVFSRRTLAEQRRSRRRKLVYAVHHHIAVMEESLRKQIKTDEAVPQRIQREDGYTPYPVVAPSADDLSYDTIVEFLEMLDLQDEAAETVVDYFHYTRLYLAVMNSFDSDYVRSWSQSRKLAMWEEAVEHRKDALEHATATKREVERAMRAK